MLVARVRAKSLGKDFFAWSDIITEHDNHTDTLGMKSFMKTASNACRMRAVFDQS